MNAPAFKPTAPIQTYGAAYIRAGFAVLALHGSADGACACGDAACERPGAHARNPAFVATSNGMQLASFLSRYPDSGLAIATGAPSHIFVLRAVARSGGLDSVDVLVERYGPLPDTLTASGAGGDRLWLFKLPPNAKVNRTLGSEFPGVEVVADGGHIVVEPSRSPLAVTWVDWEPGGEELRVADAPGWLLDLASGKPVETPVRAAPTPVPAAALAPITPAPAPGRPDALPSVTNEEFLRAVFGELAQGESAWVCAFPEAPTPAARWGGWAVQPGAAPGSFDPLICNTYYSVSVLAGPKRQKKYMSRMAVLVADDVDLATLKAEPSYVLETSPGKHQAGFIISSGGDDLARCDRVMTELGRLGLVGADKSGNNVVRYVRLPEGVNTKPRESGRFAHRLTVWHPERQYALDEAAGALGIDLGARAPAVQAPAAAPGQSATTSLAERVAAWRKAISEPDFDSRSYHDTLTKWAASKLATGMAPGAVVEDLRAEMLVVKPTAEQCTAQGKVLQDELRRWQERYDGDIPHAVNTAEAKFAAPADDIRIVKELDEVAPTAADRIPGVLGQVEDYHNATSLVRQPAFSCATAIALGSVALGRLYVARANFDSYSSTYLCEIGATGCGKEHARTVVEKFLEEAQLTHLIGQNGYTSAAGVHAALVHQPTHFTCLNELGRHLASIKNGKDSFQTQVLTELMQVFGAQHSSYRYRGYGSLSLKDAHQEQLRKIVLSPALTLLGQSTPNALFDAVGVAGLMDGFMNRMLFFFGDDMAHRAAFGEQREPIAIPKDVIDWLKDVRRRKGDLWQHTKHDVRPEPIVLNFDDAAIKVMRELDSQVNQHRAAASKAGLGDVWVRTVEKAAKLALIATVSDGRPVIGRTHAEWAARLALAADRSLERAAAGNIAETEHGRLCNDIWRTVVKNNRKLTVNTLSEACWRYRDAKKRDRADALETMFADRRLAKEWVKGENGRNYEYLVAAKPA